MDFQEVVDVFKELRERYPELKRYSLGISYGKKTLGWCQNRPAQIKISMYHMLGSKSEEVIHTLKHECAHALDYEEMGYSSGHGANWSKWCGILGINDSRLHSGAYTEKRPQSKYTLTCPVYGKKSQRHKMPKGRHSEYREYSCGSCSGRTFNRDYILEVTVNY